MDQIDEIISPDGKKALRFYVRPDSLIWFEELYENFDDLASYESYFWESGYQSGLYDDLAAAQVEALKITPWLRQTN